MSVTLQLFLFVAAVQSKELIKTHHRQPFGPKMCNQLCRQVKQCAEVSYCEVHLSCQLYENRVENAEKKSNAKTTNRKKTFRITESLKMGRLEESKERVTWSVAMTTCSQKRRNLIEIKSREKEKAVILHPSYNGFNHHESWLGLKDKFLNDTYYWMNRRPLTFHHWGYEQPSHSSGDCVYVSWRSMTWSVSNCEKKRNFICQN